MRGWLVFNYNNKMVEFEENYCCQRGLQEGLNCILKPERDCSIEMKECIDYFNNNINFVIKLLKIKLNNFKDEDTLKTMILQLANKNKILDVDLDKIAKKYIIEVIRSELLKVYRQIKQINCVICDRYLVNCTTQIETR